MPKWTDYTIKTAPVDKDEVMILDTAGKANKRLGLSALSNWILDKLADKVFQKLETNNKTVLGAINELNSNRLTAYAQETYDEITINVDGYASLAKDDIDISKCKFATIANYESINPKTAITIYASPRKAFVIGEPGAIIHKLVVNFWK